MDWIPVLSISDLDDLDGASFHQPILIYKHSSRCGTSMVVRQRLLRSWNNEDMNGVKTYFVNVISEREISQRIMHRYNVEHQSPQVLIISKGLCIYHTSHFGIEYDEIKNKIHSITSESI